MPTDDISKRAFLEQSDVNENAPLLKLLTFKSIAMVHRLAPTLKATSSFFSSIFYLCCSFLTSSQLRPSVRPCVVRLPGLAHVSRADPVNDKKKKKRTLVDVEREEKNPRPGAADAWIPRQHGFSLGLKPVCPVCWNLSWPPPRLQPANAFSH